MFGKIGSFFRESRQELAKVNWPTREGLFSSALLVIVVTLIAAAVIFVIDLMLSLIMKILLR